METAPVSPILTDEFLTNATAVITRLREEEPIHFIPGPDCWFATRYDDVRRLFTDPNFSADRRLWEKYEPPPAGSFRAWTEDHGLGSSDEPQTRLRRLVSSALTPRAVRRMEDQVRDVVEQFAAPLRERTGVIDMIAEYTNPIPNAVISRITGIPPKGGDEIRFRQLAQDVIRGFFTFASEEIRQRSDQASEEMADWVRTMAEERRRSPREESRVRPGPRVRHRRPHDERRGRVDDLHPGHRRE